MLLFAAFFQAINQPIDRRCMRAGALQGLEMLDHHIQVARRAESPAQAPQRARQRLVMLFRNERPD